MRDDSVHCGHADSSMQTNNTPASCSLSQYGIVCHGGECHRGTPFCRIEDTSVLSCKTDSSSSFITFRLTYTHTVHIRLIPARFGISLSNSLTLLQRLWSYDLMALYKSVYYYYYFPHQIPWHSLTLPHQVPWHSVTFPGFADKKNRQDGKRSQHKGRNDKVTRAASNSCVKQQQHKDASVSAPWWI